MKNCLPFIALVLLASACGQPGTVNTSSPADSLTTQRTETASGGLTTSLEMLPPSSGDSLLLRFTVKNESGQPLRFCKWHTPFEPLLSNYLDIRNQGGEEAVYQGAMAKRVMPPPEDSYMTLQPQEAMTSEVNLTRGYLLQPGRYTVRYQGGNISGLPEGNTVSFERK